MPKMESKKVVLENGIETVNFVRAGHGLRLDQVSVDFNPTLYNMKEGSGTRKRIDDSWDKITKQNARIYNKSKFRLHDFSFNDNILNLQVGVTDYKDLHGTNLSEDSAELVDNSEMGGKRFKRLSQAIGVGGWALTTDNKIFLIKNALWKGEQGGKLDRPGGHPEPEEAVKDNGLNNETELNNEHVGAELFASEQKEIRDEINIPLENQSNQELIGIVFNLNKGGRVGLEFKINVNLSSEQVLEIYRKGDQAEADETTGLVFLDLDNLQSMDQSVVENLTPHAEGSLRFLRDIITSNPTTNS